MNGKKTYLIALGVILAAVGAVLQGELSWQQAAQSIVTALLAMTIRHGIKTSTEG